MSTVGQYVVQTIPNRQAVVQRFRETTPRVSTDGKCHLVLSVLGRSKNQAFLWLPGSLLSAYDFEPFAERLVDDGYFVLSVDHYGHGLTPMPGRDADFADFSDDLSTLLDVLGIERTVIAGFSRGAYLATEFYKNHPDQVAAIILEDGGSVAFATTFFKLPPDQLATFFESVRIPDEIKSRYFDVYDSEFEVYSNFYDKKTGGSQFHNFGFIRQVKDKWIGYGGLMEYMHMQDGSHYAKLLFQPQSVSRYAASIVLQQPLAIYETLHVPMLILDAVGTPDLFQNSAENRELASRFPHLISYRAFDCADHNIHFGCPEEFLQDIRHFLHSLVLRSEEPS